MHKYAGTPSLSQQQPITQSHFSPSNRSKSIDIRKQRQTNPFSVGGLHNYASSPKNMKQQALISDVTKRFKNISDREAPANHISDKVYANAQNQSMYNNAYQYISKKEEETPQKSRNKISQSMNNSNRNSKANISQEIDVKITKNKYTQRKLSQLERPTQLEIGGEGAPMLSLLPPLKTREISPKFAYTVGAKVRD